MSRQLSACLFATVCWFSINAAQAQQFTLDNSHTSVLFSVSHLGFSYTYGRFNTVQGSFTSSENPTADTFQFTIDANSIDSNDAKRDEHLRGPDFFNVKQFPTITFQSTSVAPPDANGITNVTGNLTMHGATRQVTLPMKKLGSGTGPYGKFRTGYYLQTVLKRSEFGMTGMVPMIGDEVSVTISFEGIKE